MRGLKRVLIVEDSVTLARSMMRAAEGWGASASWARTLGEARAKVARPPDLVLLDVRLPDGSAVELARELSRLHPVPAVVAISGQASQREALELGKAGVRAYLAKPFQLDQLTETVMEALGRPPSYVPFVSANVGHREMLEVVSEVRDLMLTEALAQAGGSRRGAARRLGVSRQAIQQSLRKER